MALDTGTAWSIYLLMAQHVDPAAPAGRSGLRRVFDNNVAAGNSGQAALVSAAQSQLGLDVRGIGDPGDLSSNALRGALGLDGYTGPDCPGGPDQAAIVNALKDNI
jgi:hypothetical protein